MSSEDTPGRKKFRLRRPTLAVIAAAAILAVAAGYWLSRGKSGAGEAGPLFAVAQGPLTISVTEPGAIKPREQITILSEVEGRTTVLYIVPEGRHVKKGELLVELDVTQLDDSRVNQDIVVQNADALFVQARENVKNVKTDAEAEIDRTELVLRFAREDLDQYKNGTHPNALKEQAAKIALAQRDLEQAVERLKWSKTLFGEKYLSETELRADELTVTKQSLDVELAKNNLSLLTDFTYKRRLAQLESDLKQAEIALDRTKRRHAANITQAEVALRARESEFRQQSVKLDKLKAQIAKGKILAPREGMVVYATSAKGDWRGNTEPLAAGQMVREREELICLPTASTFMAEVKVHESNLDKIREGQRVRVTVDALPGRHFAARVASVAILPDPTSMFMNPDLKLYRTEIHIDEGSEVLRTGMSCSAEIVVAEYPSAIFLPVQCVVSVKGQTTVFVKTGSGAVPRPVQLGLDNNRMVHVLSGVSPGEQVQLAPPLDLGTASDSPAAKDRERPLRPPEQQSPAAAATDDDHGKEPPAATVPDRADAAVASPEAPGEAGGETKAGGTGSPASRSGRGRHGEASAK